MSSPVIPLTPEQETKQESQAAHEGWLHRCLVAFDQLVNVIVFRGRAKARAGDIERCKNLLRIEGEI